jgi:hypothetical protein
MLEPFPFDIRKGIRQKQAQPPGIADAPLDTGQPCNQDDPVRRMKDECCVKTLLGKGPGESDAAKPTFLCAFFVIGYDTIQLRQSFQELSMIGPHHHRKVGIGKGGPQCLDDWGGENGIPQPIRPHNENPRRGFALRRYRLHRW